MQIGCPASGQWSPQGARSCRTREGSALLGAGRQPSYLEGSGRVARARRALLLPPAVPAPPPRVGPAPPATPRPGRRRPRRGLLLRQAVSYPILLSPLESG